MILPDIGGNRTSPLDTFTLAPASRSDTSSPSSVGCIYEEEEDPCIICHDELETGPVFKLGCSHRFHKKCIDQWLQRHNTCPTCRELIALKAARRW
ncbi:hypothetical protein LSAT2_006833 [Lamellibrachia satsuma]|nr:hypothetical protein LSAT2_006833 [Lamellibrachia satsuma]